MSILSDTIRKSNHHFCTAVVVAAGISSRMGEDKLSLSLAGIPVLAYSLKTLNDCPAIDELIVVTREEKLDFVGTLKKTYSLNKLSKIILGGETRTRSALNGVSEASPKAKIICIHDGARPLVTDAIICDAIHQAVLHHAAAPAIPVKDTIKVMENRLVAATPDRSKLFAVQTPQAFQPEIIKAALTKAVSDQLQFTDDCAAVEALGVKPFLSLGSEENLKITTPTDMILAESILKMRGEISE